MLYLTDIRIYPIKSLGGISLTESTVEKEGLRHDRRWLLITPEGRFITQRAHPHMALIDVALADDSLYVWHRHRPDDRLEIGLNEVTEETLSVTIWNDTVMAAAVGDFADRWLSQTLGFPCRLVRLTQHTRRAVDPDYARPGDEVSFADGYPMLLLGQASLDELNRRLAAPLEMLRFRPNLIVSGSLPHEEDTWYQFRIGETSLLGVKPCARCVLTTIDPQTGEQGREPLRTLATYRNWNHKILFGQNVIPADGQGIVRVGDAVEILEQRPARLSFP